MSDLIVRGWQARLYPTAAQADRLNQWTGSCRFLWNRLLEREKAEYQSSRKFIWRKDLQPIAVGMKRQAGLEWLADLPAHAVLDTVARLDGALRRMVQQRKAGRECGYNRRSKDVGARIARCLIGQHGRLRLKDLFA
jgi:transposase